MKLFIRFKKKIIVVLVFFCLGTFFVTPVKASDVKETYPRLANYFLKWEISDSEVYELAKWDLLILDMEVQENSREEILKIKLEK